MKEAKEKTGREKFRIFLSYLIKHNQDHAAEMEQWEKKLEAEGWQASAREVKEAVRQARRMDEHLEAARKELVFRSEKWIKPHSPPPAPEEVNPDFKLKQIGTIHTPYRDFAPYQPREDDEGEFIIEVDPVYQEGLNQLEEFRYIYVLYYLHRKGDEVHLNVQSPWSMEEVGLFASRSSHRPNPLGLSVVRIYKIEDNQIFTSGLDVFDGTPLLDIKPYLQELDSKDEAGYGWLSGREAQEHLLLHIKGIPH
ncbi:MAG: tRNA (N6-threonylcarbamoyladenosine(37)-N6)-methyltransferase TrmO [Candidatus Auribacterota bacterium]|nr:tRNA (N6-threonylcarbamoyladenosine(37)-N6)-methyltransferase TrmO [Candidatus Auribacterota bacterium]